MPKRRRPRRPQSQNTAPASAFGRTELLRLTELVEQNRRDSIVQFQRIAQIQAELDEIRRAWERMGRRKR